MKHLYFGRKAPPKPPNIEAGSILAAFPTAHPCGNDKLEVGFVFDALLLQCGDQPLGGFLIRHVALCLLFPSVLVGSPGRVLQQKTALHGIGENPAQTGVDSLNGALGERFFRHRVLLFRKRKINRRLARSASSVVRKKSVKGSLRMKS